MKTFILSLLLLISFNSYAQFRNTTWGMEIEKVKKIESAKLEYEGRNSLNYTLNVDDLICRLEYSFNSNNALISITYIFKYQIENRTIKESLFERITNQIQEKYSQPTDKPTQKIYLWDLKDFSIKAIGGDRFDEGSVKIIYTPPAPSLKDIL